MSVVIDRGLLCERLAGCLFDDLPQLRMCCMHTGAGTLFHTAEALSSRVPERVGQAPIKQAQAFADMLQFPLNKYIHAQNNTALTSGLCLAGSLQALAWQSQTTSTAHIPHRPHSTLTSGLGLAGSLQALAWQSQTTSTAHIPHRPHSTLTSGLGLAASNDTMWGSCHVGPERTATAPCISTRDFLLELQESADLLPSMTSGQGKAWEPGALSAPRVTSLKLM
eukprot:1154432-Pelagomonas_calceolata.AAC.5